MKNKKIYLFIVCISILIAVGITCLTVKAMNQDAVNITRGNIGNYGIDVSSYNGAINWNQVKESGISFVIIRATCYSRNNGQGENGTKLCKDQRFEEYYAGAKSVGLKVGAYVYSYASSAYEADKEAELVVSYLNHRPLDLPVYYDIEDQTRKNAYMIQENTDMAVAFCEKIKASDYWPGVYSSASFLTSYIQIDRLRTYDMWAARYLLNDVIPFGADMTKVNEVLGYKFTYGNKYTNIYPAMWQYSEKGTVSGINGYIDLNYRY